MLKLSEIEDKIADFRGEIMAKVRGPLFLSDFHYTFFQNPVRFFAKSQTQGDSGKSLPLGHPCYIYL